MNLESGRQMLWTPETPTKPNPSGKRVVDFKGGSVIELDSDQMNGEDRVLETRSFHTPVESNVPNAPGEESNRIPQCEEMNTKHGEFDPYISPSSPSKKRNNHNELKRKQKKKVYRPKIVLDAETLKKPKKKTNKPNPKPNIKPKTKPKDPMETTPKASTPKKKRNDVIKTPSCKCSLLSFLDDELNEEEAFFSFLGNNGTIDHQGGFEGSIWKNSLGIQHNLLKNYEKLASLSSSCLIESRQLGINFPRMCKRKRVQRERVRLENLLTPFKKGTRSKSFTRKKKCNVVFTIEGMRVTKAMKSIIMKIRSLKKKKKKKKKRKTKHNDDEIVVYGGNDQLVTYKGPNKKVKVEVALDEETLREWSLIMSGKKYEESDENRRRHWEDERYKYRCMVEVFMSYMHVVLGNRKFSLWKGSVLDSVVGAYLTQNVSDHLSSSAYMSLAAKYPVKTHSLESFVNDQDSGYEMVGRTLIFPRVELEEDIEDIKVEETMQVQKVMEIEEFFQVDHKEQKVKVWQEVNKESQEHWDSLRRMYKTRTRHSDHADSVDWEAVRCAQVSEIAKAIENRGQHNVIAGRIKGLLNELNDLYGSLDLEWLRYVQPQEAKDYLLNIYGVGLKSVECIRLLTLQNQAFPVDVNVGRIAVRLGWVPLQPLPEETQIHNLEKYPLFDSIQKYLWPRLCTLDPDALYQLHYQLITFGKVFCTKKNPNCNACPMKGECRHFESARASANVGLPRTALENQPMDDNSFSSSSNCEVNQSSTMENKEASTQCEPIIEMPSSPEPESTGSIDDSQEEEENNEEQEEEFVTINLSSQESFSEKQNNNNNNNYYYSKDEKLKDDEKKMATTKCLVAFPDAGNIPAAPKMKNVARLRTERLVYVLNDGHPLLQKYIPRDPRDPYPYLLAIWTAGELESSGESTTKNSMHEEEDILTVPGTLLIPCRSAMRGRFPLNGTYFQVNEVFADFDSMENPIDVPRTWIWNLEKRITYFGTGTSSIMRGLSAEQIHNCFWKGFVCVRAIDIKTGAPRPLSYKFHRNTMAKAKEGNGKRNKKAQQNDD